MTMQPHAELESRTKRVPKVLRVNVARGQVIDVFANAALRWLCRTGASPGTWIVGTQRPR
jgi:hypothetical protein